MPQGGGGGVRFHSTGFGPGFAFGGMHPNMARAQQQQRQQQQQQGDSGLMGQLIQLLPLLLIMLLSFFNMPGDSATGTGGSRYFSLTVSVGDVAKQSMEQTLSVQCNNVLNSQPHAHPFLFTFAARQTIHKSCRYETIYCQRHSILCIRPVPPNSPS